MGVAQKNHVLHLRSASKHLWYMWSTMQLQNQRKRFLFNLIYKVIRFLLKYDPKILLYENILHTPSHGEIFSGYPGLHSK